MLLHETNGFLQANWCTPPWSPVSSCSSRGQILQENIGISEGSDVEIIIFSKEDISYEDDEASLDEDMLKLAANNPAFDFLKDPREDIYTIDDLKERYQ